MIRQLLRICSAALIAMVMATLAPVGTASAAGLGLQYVSATSASDSNPGKSAQVSCPPGKKLVGASAQINTSASGRVRVHGLVPITDAESVPNGAKAIGAELGTGTTSNWTVTVHAACANASALPGLKVVSNSTSPNSTSPKTAFVSCPSGKKALATGAQIFGVSAGERVALTEIETNTLGGEAHAIESISSTSDWRVEAYAICADSTALPFASLQKVSKSNPLTGLNSSKLTLACPTGKKLLSAGGQINTSDGKAIMDELTIFSDLSGVNIVGIKTAAATSSTFYSVRADAHCVTP